MRILLSFLFFLSGFSGLFFEILWMRNLRLMLGSTAEAVSLTLAAYFLGIALGNRWWGNRIGQSTNGLRVYAMLEAAIAVTALATLNLIIFEFLFGGLLQGGRHPFTTQVCAPTTSLTPCLHHLILSVFCCRRLIPIA